MVMFGARTDAFTPFHLRPRRILRLTTDQEGLDQEVRADRVQVGRVQVGRVQEDQDRARVQTRSVIEGLETQKCMATSVA